MKKIIALLIIVSLIIGAVLLVKKRQLQIDEAPTVKKISTTVKAYKPTIKEINESESFLASLQAVNQPQISSKISSYVKKVFVKESDVVKKGELLVAIDDTEVMASIDSLKANRTALKQDLAFSYKSLKRAKALYDIGGISKEAYELAELTIDNKKAKLIVADKNIKAKENLLTYTKILSPIDGVVGTIFIKEGSLSAPSKPIMTIISDEKRLIFSYPPSTLVKVGQKVKVAGFNEEITSIYQNAKNSLKSAEILLQNDLQMPSGTSVNIKVLFTSKKGTVVPINALLHDDGISVMVYEEGTFSKQKVRVEASDDEFAIISPSLDKPVALGSESKLSRLPTLGKVKVVFDEK